MFGERLKYALKIYKIKQKDLAKAIGVDTKTVTRWIKGTSEPHASNIVAICECLGLSSDLLLGINLRKENK